MDKIIEELKKEIAKRNPENSAFEDGAVAGIELAKSIVESQLQESFEQGYEAGMKYCKKEVSDE